MSLLWGRPVARGPVESRALSFADVFATGGDTVAAFGDVAAHSSLVPLFAAHREIIDAVAGVPLHGYRRAADGTLVEMSDDPSIIRPVVGTRYTWVQQCVASLLSDGNAYGLPTGMTSGGWPDRIVWTDPADWAIDDSELIPRYNYRGRSFGPSEIVHIPWIQRPGQWRGISPLRAFKDAWQAGESAQAVAKSWFGGGAIPSGHLRNIAQTLDASSSTAAKSLFRAAVRGRDVLVTGKDWEYSPIGVPADEQRFVEQMRLTASQVAAIYGLPPEDVGGEAANSLTYATVEGNERRRAQRVSAPWCARIEQALTALTPRPVVIKFNLDATVRADLATRMAAHAVALDNGVRTLAEVRVLEDLAPLTDEQWLEWARWQTARGKAGAKDAAMTADQGKAPA